MARQQVTQPSYGRSLPDSAASSRRCPYGGERAIGIVNGIETGRTVVTAPISDADAVPGG